MRADFSRKSHIIRHVTYILRRRRRVCRFLLDMNESDYNIFAPFCLQTSNMHFCVVNTPSIGFFAIADCNVGFKVKLQMT